MHFICKPCQGDQHDSCPNPKVVYSDGSTLRRGTWCDCQHKDRNRERQ